MIKARIAEENKICLVFETMQSPTWEKAGKVNGEGITPLLKSFAAKGASIPSISAVCLTDVVQKPKSADFKAKQDYITELFETYGFNVVVPVGAGATEKMLGYKGASKYFGKVMKSDVYPGMKVVPCPNPAAAAYDPRVTDQVATALDTIVANMESPDFPAEDRRELHYEVVDTIDKFNAFMDLYMSDEVKAFAFDTETTGFGFNRNGLLTIQFSHSETCAHLIPTNFYGVWSEEEWDQVKEGIRRLFADESKTVIAHNLKFDALFINHHLGVPLRKRNTFDTMIAHFLCDETTPHGLKDLACAFTDMGDYEFELDKWKKDFCKRTKTKVGEFSYDLIPFDILTYYAQADADVTMRLYNKFKSWLEEEEQEEVFTMVMRFQYLLTVMERNGSPVDVAYAKEYLKKLDPQIAELSRQLATLPCVKAAEELINEGVKKPKPFNFNSTNQKRTLFYDILKQRFAFFPKVKNDVRGMSPRRKEALAKKLYKEVHNKDYPKDKDFNSNDYKVCFRPKGAVDKRSLNLWHKETEDSEVKELVDLLKRYSELVKIRNTYVVSVLEKTVEGRIHPKFNVIGARSGRLSSSDPNYQNIPAHSDEAKKVKCITCAPEGWTLSGSDLSAAEMRWVTVASGDEKMAAIFNSGVDSHGAIAKDIFSLECHANEVKDLHKAERQIAKACQFLSVYGGQADALAATAGISVERAEEILDSYFEKYTGISDYIDRTKDYICEHGYSKSLLGRKNRHPSAPGLHAKVGNGLTNMELMDLEKAMRVGVNATIQSVSSDGMLLAVCNLQDEIEEYDLPMQIINVIHDAVYVLIRNDFLEEGNAIILKHLQRWPEKLRCPFTGNLVVPEISMVADSEVGKSWDTLTPMGIDPYAEVVKELLGEDDEEDEDSQSSLSMFL